jgi:hypothetical protein
MSSHLVKSSVHLRRRFDAVQPSRRELLRHIACGFGHLALVGLVAAPAEADSAGPRHANPLAPKPPHFPPKAKRVIFLFMHGGVSHVDSFDPKPRLAAMDGQPLPFAKPQFQFAGSTGNLLKSPWRFTKFGQSGIEVSELFPHIGSCMDDICVIRSMNGSSQVSHGPAALNLHTGDGVFMRPSMGAWVLYGLGTENQNLPGFVTISPSSYHGGDQNYGSAFLPASYQATRIGDGSTPFRQARISNLAPAETQPPRQRLQLDLLAKMNREHLIRTGEDARLAARIEAFELTFRMQMEAPQMMDLSGETKETYALYGIDEGVTDEFGRQCLLARRLCEHGVRFV